MAPAPGFPSMKAKRLLALLRSLGYQPVPGRGKGSHTVLRSEGRPQIIYAFHSNEEIGPVLLRRILIRNVGLTLDEALEVLRNV